MEQTFKIKGMHCASCANIIESTLKKTPGVKLVEVNYATESVKLSFDELKTNPQNLSEKIVPLGYSLVFPKANQEIALVNKQAKSGDFNESFNDQAKQEKLSELADMKVKILSALPMAGLAILAMLWDILAQYKIVSAMNPVISNFFHYLLPLLATYILFVVGKPYLLGFYRFIRYGKANMDTLIGLGTLAAYLYSFALKVFEEILRPFINVDYQYYDVTIVVITFIALGKYLETKSKIKTGDAITKLLDLQAKTALVVRGSQEVEISIKEVQLNDLIIVKPGAKIPVDGLVTQGTSFVDESLVTGESMPIQKKVGDTVVAGTINASGSFIFKATKVGGQTLLAQIIKMVQEAQGSKAPIQALADKISSVFVPIVLVGALITLGAWLVIGYQSLGLPQALSFGLSSFVGILVIACPCALGLATPTAIIVGVGKGAKEGILIKDAATLEKLHKVKVVVVDKTGTLTEGKPTLVDIKNLSNHQETEFISLIASLENKSEHPIAQSIVNYAQEKNIDLVEVIDFENLPGRGVRGLISGQEYFIGNIKLVSDLNLVLDLEELKKFTIQGKTPVILATKDKVLGFIMVADTIKKASTQAVKDLQALGIKVVMLTGDNMETAQYIGSLVGVNEVKAEVLPQDKLIKIKDLQAQGLMVAMAGDGVNDAPALAQADVGIAMATGTDVAIESAGITLLRGDISKLVKAIKLSKITMTGIKQNLFWAFIYNIVGIPLAAGLFYPLFGWLLSPVFAGFAMAMSSVSVVANSLRIKTKKL
ncbi:cadmium-translocating P-type ATPase [Patescibacteria group bacterium]|nr:cadmium-translocating P-type ATPase [Patescibacteria group bacterium]